jgi:hypothetical protein
MNEQQGDRAERERAVMDVVRRQVERDVEPQPRRTLQRVAALGIALLVSGTLFLGFDLFLTAMQRFMDIEPPQQVAEPREPMQVFAVPGDEEGSPERGEEVVPAGQDDPAAEPWLPALIEQDRAAEPGGRAPAEQPAAAEPAS